MTANRLSQALRMLTSGRVELISSNKSTLLDLIKTQQLDPAQFEVRWMLSSEQYCFAFSHPVDDALVREFQLGLTQVLASSEFQQRDWPRLGPVSGKRDGHPSIGERPRHAPHQTGPRAPRAGPVNGSQTGWGRPLCGAGAGA